MVLAAVVPLLLAGTGAHALLDQPPTKVCITPMLPDALSQLEDPICFSAPLPSGIPFLPPLPF
jgi:hypothetical protein